MLCNRFGHQNCNWSRQRNPCYSLNTFPCCWRLLPCNHETLLSESMSAKIKWRRRQKHGPLLYFQCACAKWTMFSGMAKGLNIFFKQWISPFHWNFWLSSNRLTILDIAGHDWTRLNRVVKRRNMLHWTFAQSMFSANAQSFCQGLRLSEWAALSSVPWDPNCEKVYCFSKYPTFLSKDGFRDSFKGRWKVVE